MSKITQGEWKFKIDDAGFKIICGDQVLADSNDAGPRERLTEELTDEAYANFKLMSAGPEMALACDMMRNALKSPFNQKDDGVLLDGTQVMILLERISTALSKAGIKSC